MVLVPPLVSCQAHVVVGFTDLEYDTFEAVASQKDGPHLSRILIF